MPRLTALLVALAACALASGARGQTFEFVGAVQFETDPSFDTGGSDVWAYTAPDGSEYALMGVLDGLAVVAVPSLEVVARIPGPSAADIYYHRDIKTLGHYAYVVTECFGPGEGMQILDLSGLPASVRVVDSYEGPSIGGRGRVVSSHNLSIDVARERAYVLDSRADGLAIVDLSAPEAPAEIGYLPLPDVHDVYARNDTLWVAEGYQPTFSLWNAADASAPELIARVTIPASGYVHNIWPTDDGRYALTTEETSGKTVKVWDVQDPADITLVGEWLGASGLAHNAHVAGDYAYISHYASGVHLVDISDVAAPVEVARYDTYAASDESGFVGNWGTIPPTPGGYVYGSDLEGALTVLRVSGVTVASEPEAPEAPEALTVGPNPTSGAVTVAYTLAESSAVRLSLVDALGREARVVTTAARSAGTHRAEVPLASLPPGAYVVRLQTDRGVVSRPFTVAR